MTARASVELTRSVEDYLKAIFRLSGEGRAASTTDIAQQLELSPASVSAMVKRLSEQDLLAHEPYRGVKLTAAGRRAALRVVRRHRLIEAYLVAFLGFDWDTVHPEAERLEHAVSDALVERMAAALGNPTHDPHGDPIPASDGSMTEVEAKPLTQWPAGAVCVLTRVSVADAERLRYVASLGLRPGVSVVVEEQAPFDGPVTVRVGKARRVIGNALAACLLCAPGELP